MQKYIVWLMLFLLLSSSVIARSIEEIIGFKNPFVLSELVGSINSEAGQWPDDFASSYITFKLIGPAKAKKAWKIKLDNNGRFRQILPKGVYKFTIEVEGWDDAEGIVKITKKADRKNKMEIVLGLS